jgi:hypothetical protein
MKIYVCSAKASKKPYISGAKAFTIPRRMLSRAIFDRQKRFWGRSRCKITLNKTLVHIKTAPPVSSRKGEQSIKKMLVQYYPTFLSLRKESERLFPEIRSGRRYHRSPSFHPYLDRHNFSDSHSRHCSFKWGEG